MNVSIEQKVQQKSKKPNDEADIITENTLISNLEERRSKSNKTLVRQISMKEINLEDPGLWSVKILNLSSCSNINRKGTVYQVKNLDFPISKSGRKFSKFDNIVREHIQRIERFKDKRKRIAHYLGNRIQNEIITLITTKIKEALDLVRKSKYSIPDISHTKQLSIVVCFVLLDAKVVQVREHFLGFSPITNSTGEGLSEFILEELSKLKLNVYDIRGQGYDNGTNMRGKHNGLQRKIVNINSRANTHTAIHIKESLTFLTNLTDFLKKCRSESFENILTTANDLAKELEIESNFISVENVRRRNKPKNFDYENIDEVIQESKLHFKVNLYYCILYRLRFTVDHGDGNCINFLDVKVILNECRIKFDGQTKRKAKTRIKEHRANIKKSKDALTVVSVDWLESQSTYGSTLHVLPATKVHKTIKNSLKKDIDITAQVYSKILKETLPNLMDDVP
ncbi:hypothetical protein ALC60_07613 [Trachymyrmex zeteki]|uniref:Uncharacterized protein n=1 Tax=Mycetomoellerius zeteki TaxID=64791 RepID=A0A151WZC3_9HYME|nr:hypothetical protein ALC60_07613 [Trachymyrmex zeteki]